MITDERLLALHVRMRLLGFASRFLYCEYGSIIVAPRGYVTTMDDGQGNFRFRLRLRNGTPEIHYYADDEFSLAAMCVNAGLADLPKKKGAS